MSQSKTRLQDAEEPHRLAVKPVEINGFEHEYVGAGFEEHGGGLLYVLGGEGLPAHQVEGEVEVVRFSRPVENFLERAVAFVLEQLLATEQ